MPKSTQEIISELDALRKKAINSNSLIVINAYEDALMGNYSALRRAALKGEAGEELVRRLECIRIDSFETKGSGPEKLYPIHQYDERVLRELSAYRSAVEDKE